MTEIPSRPRRRVVALSATFVALAAVAEATDATAMMTWRRPPKAQLIESREFEEVLAGAGSL